MSKGKKTTSVKVAGEKIEISEDHRAVMVPLDRLVESPDNPRSSLGDLSGLAASIEAVGILQPLTIVPLDDTNEQFRVIAGHRRRAAAELVDGVDAVPAIIRKDWSGDDEAQQVVMLVENLHREDLSPLDRAHGFERLTAMGLSQKDVAEKTGLSQPTVSKTLGILKLPPKGQEWVADGKLTIEEANRLAALPKRDIEDVLDDDDFYPGYLDRVEKRLERELAFAAEVKKLEDAGVTVFADNATMTAAKAKDLTELHWVRPGPHKKLDCRAVRIAPGETLREACTKPRSHPKPGAQTTAEAEKPDSGLEEAAKLWAELEQANLDRNKWIKAAMPTADAAVGFAARLLVRGDIDMYGTMREVVDLLGVEASGDDDTVRDALVAWMDDGTKLSRALFATVTTIFENGFVPSRWKKDFEVDEGYESDTKAYMEQLEILGYVPSVIERRFVGLPLVDPNPEVTAAKANHEAPAIAEAFESAAVNQTEAEELVDDQSALEETLERAEADDSISRDNDEPAIPLPTFEETKNQRHIVTCSQCGLVGRAPATTEEFVKDRWKDHLWEAHGIELETSVAS